MRPSSFTKHMVVALSLVMLLPGLLLTGCDVNISSNGNAFGSSSPSSSSANGTCQLDCTTGSGAQGVQVFVEPDAGDQVITNAIASAHKAVLLEMYLLTDRKIISALEEAAQRGVDVRVMLEPHPYGSGSVSPTETLDRLSAAGVKTRSTSSSFSLTHEKGIPFLSNV